HGELPVLARGLGDRPEGGDAGVVTHDVDRAEAAQRGFGQRLDALGLRHIRVYPECLRARLLEVAHCAFERRLVQVGEPDVRAPLRKRFRHGRADAASPARDHRHPVFEWIHGPHHTAPPMRDRYELPEAPDAGTPPGATRVGTFAALGMRNFRVLWSGTWASYIPFFMSNVVNGVVAFQLAHVNRAFGSVVFAQGLAMACLAPLGGAGADRWPKRRLLAASQTIGALVFGTFALLLAFDSLT